MDRDSTLDLYMRLSVYTVQKAKCYHEMEVKDCNMPSMRVNEVEVVKNSLGSGGRLSSDWVETAP